MQVLDRPHPQSLAGPTTGVDAGLDEAAARRSLRRQIARLERQLGDAATSAFPRTPARVPTGPAGGPGILTIGQLEEARDELAVRIGAARGTTAGESARHERNRRRLERMMLEPDRHRYARVTREDVGETGCGGWEVRPRLGLLGMVAGWWRVKVSSGCPLATRQPDGTRVNPRVGEPRLGRQGGAQGVDARVLGREQPAGVVL
jgi:hypothetical protein